MSRARAVLALACLGTAGLLLAGCGGGDDEGTGTTETTSTAGSTAGGCEAVDAPEPRDDGGATAPTEPLDPDVTYTLTFVTNCGSFAVTLDQKAAPQTAASLVSLARDGFYDDTVFHRIVPGFVIQGGDPTATGTGGPGYQTVDPPPPDAAYTKGVVAMAKGADEAPGTSGSQFFVVTGDDIGLPPEYAAVGTVTAGQDVVDRIGELGDPSTEEPTEPVVISTVTVAES
jgi:cyclophilin family peptidyl-prolyl cis-trans isomerase